MKIIAIVGSYRKGGVVDRVIDEILDAARREGAECTKFYLVERRIEFCLNCRACTQEGGKGAGECVIDDDMRCTLEEIATADALVLGSPMNFGTVTAVTKRFIERLICFAHWPWGTASPRIRDPRQPRRAVIVSASAAPALIARWSTRIVGLLRRAVGLLGGRTIGVVFVGLAALEMHPSLPRRVVRKARALGRRLAAAPRS